MKKPNKAQRLTIYKKVLEYVVNNGWTNGLCFSLTVYGGFDGYKDNMPTNYPEIWKRKPKQLWDIDYWFDFSKEGNIQRERILKLAIKELTPKKK